MNEKTTIRKINRNFQITLPPDFRERFGLHEGDYVEVTEEETSLTLRPVATQAARKQLLKQLDEIFAKTSDNPYANLPEEEEVMKIVNKAIAEVRAERKAQQE
ncbi:AbrB/MazE/SpoVT family DNA-binding domain-containing protein [Candidatus Magnetomonas plexicatena]|uniref:AbrB/MazE/SpoVT family DNA-binding domain-containing protein n=1 Tax=Candidatus Magnetomonas plexicatena TaxID=2552947 RepID=UPI001C786047|nr:AbrB/MazE/SpoVT family DNA-binding domain-containing protein [Nitrospirales bacterium LBB_01]